MFLMLPRNERVNTPSAGGYSQGGWHVVDATLVKEIDVCDVHFGDRADAGTGADGCRRERMPRVRKQAARMNGKDTRGLEGESSGEDKGAEEQRLLKNGQVYETYRQFVLDVPRMDITIKGERWAGHPTLLFMDLWGRFDNKTKATRVLKLFSQCELAQWFIMGRDKWISSDNEHFLDGGRQSLELNIVRKDGFFSSHEEFLGLTLRKPFKIVDFEDDEYNVRFIVELIVSYDFVRDSIMHSWTREIQPVTDEDKKVPDWVYIESASGPFHDSSY
mmetsp:Transcript_28251/g.45499  ORF Transcript_28251/g.45499 Transcript_28251/m.45499 type:complete len:275 (+) Transcript_28251:249-1073(+)